MKIAYINIIYGRSAGVEDRFREKARAAHALGLDLDAFYISSSVGSPGNEGYVHSRPLRNRAFPLNINDAYFNRYGMLERSLDLGRYDLILMRYPFADRSGLDFMKNHRVITEHHTDEMGELRSQLENAPNARQRMITLMLYLQECRFGRRVLGTCAGMVSVTREICEVERQKTLGSVPCEVIPNGIDVRSITRTGFRKFDGSSLDMAFLAGSNAPWHGIDRVAEAVQGYRGTARVRLHVIGPMDSKTIGDYGGLLGDRIIFHGRKSGPDLDAVMQRMNIAVSTLALYRKNMEEACSLKTREYVARGIPFVLGYSDPDLEHPAPGDAFFLQVDNNGSPLDMEDIIAFAARVSGRHDSLPDDMRSNALAHMDWSVKMMKYAEFAQHIYQKAHGGTTGS